MDSRLNKMLMGVIILLIGVASLFQRYLSLDYSALMLIFMGLGFLLLYKTKNKIWSLAIGCFAVYIGAMRALSSIGLESFMPLGVASMFFLIPGVIFLVLYYDRNKRGLLLPGMLFIAMGVYIFIVSTGILDYMPISEASLLFVCIGAGFLLSYMLGKDFLSGVVLYSGIAIIFIGVLLMMDLFMPMLFVENMSILPSIVLIVAAVLIILRQLRKR